MKNLISKCKATIYVTINGHKNDYQSVEGYIKDFITDLKIGNDEDVDISTEVYDKMVALDTIIEIQAYNHTPVGFYKIYHYDYEKAVEEMNKILDTNY